MRQVLFGNTDSIVGDTEPDRIIGLTTGQVNFTLDGQSVLSIYQQIDKDLQQAMANHNHSR